ncbi:hypothetical protein CXB51_028679 [Gossypium anomalum]|uniref:BHLH domain-containing protein n=1 Tax=Gossypium anomalum TaxID=47600 RepID=A0A8J5Y6M2_9ROSI|nr:hypothetical protein CXB51_028679 [Gossypium anomalum]
MVATVTNHAELSPSIFSLGRETIAERIRALQELVPSVNETDRAAMLDEIVDYVKFLRLQVKFTEYCIAAHVMGSVFDTLIEFFTANGNQFR